MSLEHLLTAHDQVSGNETRANVSDKHTWEHHLGQRADDLGAVWEVRHFEVQRRQALVLLKDSAFEVWGVGFRI